MKFKTLDKVLATPVYKVMVSTKDGEPTDEFMVNYLEKEIEKMNLPKKNKYLEATVQIVTVTTQGILEIWLIA